MIAKTSLQELRQGQAMLSAAEREVLWKTKLNFFLNNTKERFTIQQRNIIAQLSKLLQKHGMKGLIENPSIGAQFLDANYAFFSRHFNKAQLSILIESPYFHENLLLSRLNDENLNTEISLLAEGGYCTCLYDMGCPGGQNSCDQTGCTTNNSYEMCGVFGTSSCKKRCSGLEPVLE